MQNFGFRAWFVGEGRIGDEESVLLVAGGMLLGYEEGVEVPEAGLNVPGLTLTSSKLYLRLASVYLLVGISSKPISKKMSRNSARTLFTEITMISYSQRWGVHLGSLISYKDVMLHS